MKDKDIKYDLQVLLEQCAYKTFSNDTIIHPVLILQILIQIRSLMIVMNLEKRFMKVLYKMNIILIVCINYALLSFYLCHFKKYEGFERFNCV